MAERGWFTGAVEGSGDFGPEPRHLQTSGSQRCHSCSAMVTPDHANCPQCGPAFPVASALEDCDLRERLERALGSKFEVRALIGRGGFADVYEIFDRQLERPLAVKVLRPEITKAPWLADRFEKETRALASLFHLNIPPIHFVGDNEGLVYYVMPLIQGRSLGAIMEQEGALGADTLADLMIPVLEALEHAHQHGIIHRDIKPDNIIIDEESGRPLLVDFGVAKYSAQELGSPDGSTTLPGMILGTPGYISPEQALGNPVDGRSDVYSMGSTMFHLLTGVTTFAGDSPRSIIGRQITEEAPIPAAMNAAIPEWLSDVIVCALARRPEARYQSAAAMAEALRIGWPRGRRQPVPQAQPLERIRDDDPTPLMVPVGSEVLSESRRNSLERRRPDVSPAKRSRGNRPSVIAGISLILVGAWFLLVPQKFVLRNDLLRPIEVSTNDGAVRTIPPGTTLDLSFPDNGRVLSRWFIVQPRQTADSAPIGEPISGMVRVDALTALDLIRRKAIRHVNSWTVGSLAFAPRVVNRAAYPVKVTVNRVRGGFNCRCTIGPGETLLLGYYRLEDSSFVRVEGPSGRSVVFRNLQARMDLSSGVVDLNIVDTTLSRPPA